MSSFYLDFEATQFSERIISIGCVADNGDEFSTLVRPPKGDKVNAFITNLTGITQAMVEDADTADVCFLALRQFIREHSRGEETFFFVYGNADRVFIDRTVNKMNDPKARKFAYKLGASLIDFSEITQRFFRVGSISLKNAVAYFRQEEVSQNHHAIDDAELLRELVYMVNHNDMPETGEKINLTSKSGKSKKTRIVNIESTPIEKAKTNNGCVMANFKFPNEYPNDSWANVPLNWYPAGTILRCNKSGRVEYPYPCLENVYNYIRAKNHSAKEPDIKVNIKKAITEGTNAYHKKWKVV